MEFSFCVELKKYINYNGNSLRVDSKVKHEKPICFKDIQEIQTIRAYKVVQYKSVF
jgi:hypothetical protein